MFHCLVYVVLGVSSIILTVYSVHRFIVVRLITIQCLYLSTVGHDGSVLSCLVRGL